MTDPTAYGLGQILTSPLVVAGIVLILGGSAVLLWMYRDALGYREPERPTYRRPDSDTGVIRPPWAPLDMYREAPMFVPRIPGATPEAGPVCPICGAPFHAVCPSAPKERTEETVVLPVVEPVVDFAPQFAALGRFFAAVDEARADTDEAMHRLAATARPDCPLTTQEIPPLLDAPLYDAAIRNTDTRELSEVMKKVTAP